MPKVVEQQITSKEKILKKVRAALTYKSKSLYQNIDLESNVFEHSAEDSLVEAFAKSFTQTNGQFIYCANVFDGMDKLLDLLELKKFKQVFCWEEEIQQMLNDTGITFQSGKQGLDKIQVSVTGCESLIASTGTILFSSSRNTRTLTAWPPVHIIIGKLSMLVPDMKDALQIIRNRYGRFVPSMLSFVTGPSRTLDIPSGSNNDPQVVYGAHGPKELYLFLIDDTKRS